MSWLSKTFTSSLGKKVVMSLTGLFLCTFLVVHLIGNLQLLKNDGGEAFNLYANLMAHNPLIETVSFGLYFFIIVHTVMAIVLTYQNRKSRPVDYAVTNKKSTWESRSMMLLGTLILFFLIVHMGDFWYKYKISEDWTYGYKTYGNLVIRDIYSLVVHEFKELDHMLIYVVAQFVLAFHLRHGFQSAFQSLGLNHVKYTPAIQFVGNAFSILIPLGFVIQPLYVFFN